MEDKIKALPPRISKSDLCQLFGVQRMRTLRKGLFSDYFITQELGLDIEQFNRRQQFTAAESQKIRQVLKAFIV